MKRDFILAPSMLSADFAILGEQLKELKDCGVTHLHIDVMDGLFVPSISFGMPVIESIRKSSDLFFDLHLMIMNPERYIERFCEVGADSITIHYESLEDVEGALKLIRAQGVKAGLAIKPQTEVEKIIPYLPLLDMVLVMTVKPGFGGQKYIHSCTQKIAQLRQIIDEKQMDVLIEVDGAVNADTICEPLQAGAEILVAGTAIFTDNIRESIERLRSVPKC